jgi:hypothetical protein
VVCEQLGTEERVNGVSNDVYLMAAKVLSGMAASMKSPEEKISMDSHGVVLTLRQVLQWAVTPDGRRMTADRSDIRDGLFALAVRFMK